MALHTRAPFASVTGQRTVLRFGSGRSDDTRSRLSSQPDGASITSAPNLEQHSTVCTIESQSTVDAYWIRTDAWEIRMPNRISHRGTVQGMRRNIELDVGLTSISPYPVSVNGWLWLYRANSRMVFQVRGRSDWCAVSLWEKTRSSVIRSSRAKPKYGSLSHDRRKRSSRMEHHCLISNGFFA